MPTKTKSEEPELPPFDADLREMGQRLRSRLHGNAAKLVSLHPLQLEDAMAGLLKVKPPAKAEK